MNFPKFQVLIISMFLVMFSFYTAANSQVTITGPAGSNAFADQIIVLPNGNFVVTDPDFFRPDIQTLVGAVHLYDGGTGALLGSLYGEDIGDRVGAGGVTVLTNGNYVVGSPFWGRNGSLQDVGAATFCSGTTGCNGTVSSSASIFGSNPNDYVGDVRTITALENGNYVIAVPDFDASGVINAGAVKACSGAVGCTGTITAANSLVGANSGDRIGISCSSGCLSGIIPLKNGKFVIASPHWNGGRGAVTFGDSQITQIGPLSAANSLVGTTVDEFIGRASSNNLGVAALATGNYAVASSGWNGGRGAATFCTAATGGCFGTIDGTNSLIGSNIGDLVGIYGITPLQTGNYVVNSYRWDGLKGAATFGNGQTGITGNISAANSLVGTNSVPGMDMVGENGVVELTNGNYVVLSPNWSGSRGAATWASGLTGKSGAVSQTNSLVGLLNNDKIGLNGATKLADGDYVVNSPNWRNENLTGVVGAATWGNGANGTSGPVTSGNSIIGSSVNDRVGWSTTALTTGNYVVNSREWDNGNISNVGAVTLCTSSAGCAFVVSPSNSLIGTLTNDTVGTSGSVALTNGNYVVISNRWNDDRGAITFGDGYAGGTVGQVSALNSLVGTSPDDTVGEGGVFPLADGGYVVSSYRWNSGTGAATWGSGTTGVSGQINSGNSLIGNQAGDQVSYGAFSTYLNAGIVVLPDQGYLVESQFWRNGSIFHAGAVSYSTSSPLTGPINSANSVRGTFINGGNKFKVAYNKRFRRILIGNRDNNTIVIIRNSSRSTRFDFDGDSRTDISIFRPGPGEWWYLRSGNGGNRAFQFGIGTDKIVPADYTGDGKTDLAFFRPATGEWFILRSEDSSFYSFPFGSSGDIPVPGDFDGDGKADPTVFRPGTATWFSVLSADGTVLIRSFGANGDQPTVEDYDGDGKADLAIYRPAVSEWWQLRSTLGLRALQFGVSGDRAVPADYTGDGKADIAVWRPSNGFWFILRSEDNSFYAFPFGTNGDIPAPGDYDGDGKTDPTVFRPSDNIWYSFQSTAGSVITSFGASGDKPVPGGYVVP